MAAVREHTPAAPPNDHPADNPQESLDLHRPVLDRLDRLVRRGQDDGEFDRGLPRPWLLATLVALGHAAGEEVGAGRMDADAHAALRESVLRIFRTAR